MLYIIIWLSTSFAVLCLSGLAMNQIEMEKISDNFDRNKSGLIDLAEITAILKGQKVRKQYKAAATAKPVSDAEKIDLEVSEL